MDRAPSSMTVKEYLMRIQSVRTNIPLKTIEAVVNSQFELINDKFHDPQIESIEISGFGKFLFNTRKAQKKAEKALSKIKVFSEKLKDETLSERKKQSYQLKLDNTILVLNALNLRLNDEYKRDNGGMAEQVDSTRTSEGIDKENFGGENSNL